MFSAIAGVVLALTVTIYACTHTSPDAVIYLDWIGVVIVLGGTLAAALLTFNFYQLRQLLYSASKIFTRRLDNGPVVIAEIVSLSKDISSAKLSISEAVRKTSHPFLREGLTLIENDFPQARLREMLICSINERKNGHMKQVNMLRTLAKYPPAFGMVGTVIGLVALLQNLGNKGAVETIGPNMAVALITTLYGLLIANFVLTPLGENIFIKTKYDLKIRKIIMKGVCLIQEGEDPIIIQEVLNSYLHPDNRVREAYDSSGISEEKDAA